MRKVNRRLRRGYSPDKTPPCGSFLSNIAMNAVLSLSVSGGSGSSTVLVGGAGWGMGRPGGKNDGLVEL